MPIEFRCPECSSLLRTPDQSVGKKAKCPRCGAISEVPSAPADKPPAPPEPPGPSPAPPHDPFADLDLGQTGQTASPGEFENPFADAAAPGAGAAPPETPENPYASPQTMASEAFAPAGVTASGLRHQQIDFGQVLGRTWEIFSNNMGLCALVGLIVLGIEVGLRVVGQIGGIAAGASGEMAAIVLFQIVFIAATLVVRTWINLGVLYFGLRLVRTGQASVSDFFAVGPYLMRGIGITLLMGLINTVMALVCFLPALGIFLAMGGPRAFEQNPMPVVVAGLIGGLACAPLIIWIVMRLYLAFPFLVDRNLGVIESMSHSDQFMRGNKLMAFLITLVVGLVGGLFVCVTCSLGMILWYPYLGVLSAMIYLMCTGQPVQPFRKG